MNLVELLRHHEAKRKSYDYDFLVDNAAACGKAALIPKLAKRKANLDSVLMTVPGGMFATIAKLTAKADLLDKETKKGLPKTDVRRKTFLLVLGMFEAIPPGSPIIDQFVNVDPHGQYPFLSRSFVEKHLADDELDAWAKSLMRWFEKDTLVNTMLEPAQALALNNEIQAMNAAGVFAAFMARVNMRADRYRDRNKRVEDFAFRTRLKYTKLNCTQANNFNAEKFDDHVYFSIGWPAVQGGVRFVVDHYAPRSTVMQADGVTLKTDWKELDYAKLNPGGGRNNADAMWMAMSGGGDHFRIYVKYGAFRV